MNNNKVIANSFSIQLFGDWRYAQEDSDDLSYTFFKKEGCGALQFSSYEKDSPITIDDILKFFEEINEDCLPHLVKRIFGEFEGFELNYSDESDTFWRKVILKNNNVLLFVTYNCDLTDKNQETEEVNELLSSLKFID